MIAEGEPSFEQWQEAGKFIFFVEAANRWWIGDWWNYGEHNYGEAAAAALEDSVDYGKLRNDKWVASRIEMSRRRDNVSFSHHQEVAPLEPEDQDRFLSLVEKESWTLDELRKQIKVWKQDLAETKAGPLPMANSGASLSIHLGRLRYMGANALGAGA
jgi:hypothetical protein